MSDIRQIFESDYCGIDTFIAQVLSPIFGDYEKGYDVLTADKDVKVKASQANILEIKHAATFDFFGSELKVFDITVGDDKKLENNRVGIQSIVRQYIAQFEGALIVFHHQNIENQEWRLSYVEKQTKAKDSTSAKRYTYILGKNHPAKTITENFEKLEKDKDKLALSDLTNAFSVAPLSNEFFNEYREHYADLVEYISGKRFVKKGGKFVEEKTGKAKSEFKETFASDDKAVRDYVKKMMGRLVFLHFLQKKGWLGVAKGAAWGTGDKSFIFNLFNNASPQVKNDFLEQALEPLFFKTLNTDRGADAIAPKAVCDIYGSKIRIPYLNGGLFEEDELDKKKVKFTKKLFKSLLEFFSQYNFTIDETDPDDQEIGVDPEMLGKIFENLLEDNKDKGAFYTPKEIVQYMCRESLIAYLEEKTKIDVRDFVVKHEENFTSAQKADVLKALLDVKVCDPAVGSGAFPMGMMNELLACTQLLTGNAKTRAELKKHIVKNNIYGVDIEKGAVDIARLRFWLAIIVDEEEPLPLPNLDYKIMQGNSLLESYEGVDLACLTKERVDNNGKKADDGKKGTKYYENDLLVYGDDGKVADHVSELIKKLDSYYQPHDHEAKKQIDKEIQKLARMILSDKFVKKELLDKLEKEGLKNNSNFFLWHVWFNDVFNRPNNCNGFDIVIGNPPYISAPTQIANKKLSNQRDEIVTSKKYKSLYQKWDLYIPFIELGTILNCNNGITSMIVPFPLTNQLYSKIMRQMLTEKYEMFELCDLNGTKVFENATVSNCIPFIKKTASRSKTWISNINDNLEIKRVFEQKHSDLVQDEKTYVWNVTQEKREANRHAEMHVLGDFCYISVGMVLNADEKTAKGKFKKEELISETKDKIHCRKFIESKDVSKFSVHKIHYLEYDTKRVPNNIRRPTFRELYTTPKLMFNRLGELQVVFDEKGDFTTSDAMFVCLRWESLEKVDNKSITSSIKKFSTMKRSDMEKLSKTVDLRFLLGIMNSRYASILLANQRGGDYHIYPEHIRNIPIPSATKEQQGQIICLVDEILSCKKHNSQAETSSIESKIDQLVYKLYGLSKDEISDIENK